jgi:succinoglycan biosynthesis transport protein ExoP
VERDDVISLQDYLTILRRRRWLVLGTIVAVVVTALAVSFAQTPIYEAETEVVVEPVRRTQDVTLEQLLAPVGDAVQTERLIVTSRPVAERVAEELGISDVRGLLEDVRVESVADTRVVRIVAAHTDPAEAVAIADAFAAAYLDYKQDEALEGLLAARANLDARAADLRAQIDELDEDDDADQATRDALLAQLAQISAQVAELGGSAQTVTGGGSILTPAELPESPVSPRPLRTGALALVLGALLGVGLAFLRDHFDDVVRDENDFKRATGGRPVLGRIPSWSDPEGGDRLVTLVDPTALASEAYRELSSGVRFMLAAMDDQAVDVPQPLTHVEGEATPTEQPRKRGRAIVLASAAAGDGKTSTAANLAVAAARAGLTTLLVDADMRRSTVGKRFGLGRVRGLSDLLAGNGDLADHVVPVGVDGLYVLPAGTTPPNPHELLASAAMRAFERRVRESVDLVIYDTPAVLAVPDALELGRHADLAILVGRAETSSRRQLGAAIERLQQVGTDISGTVLNDISGGSDAYYYAYYYADNEQRADGGDGKKAGKADKSGSRAARRADKQAPRRAANRPGRRATDVTGPQRPMTARELPPPVRPSQPPTEATVEAFPRDGAPEGPNAGAGDPEELFGRHRAD